MWNCRVFENSKLGADWCLMPTNTCLEPPFAAAGHPSQCPARAVWLFLAWLQGLNTADPCSSLCLGTLGNDS